MTCKLCVTKSLGGQGTTITRLTVEAGRSGAQELVRYFYVERGGERTSPSMISFLTVMAWLLSSSSGLTTGCRGGALNLRMIGVLLGSVRICDLLAVRSDASGALVRRFLAGLNPMLPRDDAVPSGKRYAEPSSFTDGRLFRLVPPECCPIRRFAGQAMAALPSDRSTARVI